MNHSWKTFFQRHIHIPPNWQRWWKGELQTVLLAEMCRPLILSGDRSIKPIAASYCSQTVSSVSSLDWSNDLKAPFHFPRYAASDRPPKPPHHFPQLPFLYVIAVSFSFRVPSHLHVSISSSHHVSFSLSQPFSPWHQCKASIIEWCMGVCLSGIEGLGTPPAPPAEEALTAEHGGLIPPSLLLRPVPHLCWPPSSSNTFSISRFLPRLLFIPCCSAPVSDAHYIRSYFRIYVCPQLCLLSPIPLCPLSAYHWILLNSICYSSVINFTATAMSTVRSLIVASEVSPLGTLFIPVGRTVHKSHATFKSAVNFLIFFISLHSLLFKSICCRKLPYMSDGVFISLMAVKKVRFGCLARGAKRNILAGLQASRNKLYHSVDVPTYGKKGKLLLIFAFKPTSTQSQYWKVSLLRIKRTVNANCVTVSFEWCLFCVWMSHQTNPDAICNLERTWRHRTRLICHCGACFTDQQHVVQ